MSRPHPKVSSPITEGTNRPRHISPKPDNDYWLGVPPLEAAYAWRIALTTVHDLEHRAAFAQDTPINRDWEPWQRFKDRIRDSDELWIYSSPANFWQIGMGSRGVVLVRDEVPVDILTLAFN